MECFLPGLGKNNVGKAVNLSPLLAPTTLSYGEKCKSQT